MRGVISFSMLFWCCLTFDVSARLIQWDAFNPDDNLAVKDQATGLVWLDLSLTAGMSYTDAGLQYAGWEHADHAQVESLFNTSFIDFQDNSGIGAFNQCQRGNACFDQASTFSQLFGYTPHSLAPDFHYSFGLFQDQFDVLRMMGTIVQNPLSNTNIYSTQYQRDYSGFNRGGVYNLSTYLVQVEDVEQQQDDDLQLANSIDLPEPSSQSLALFGLGMLLVMRVFKR